MVCILMSILRRKDYLYAGYLYKSFTFGKDIVNAEFIDVYTPHYSLRLTTSLPLFIPHRFTIKGVRWI